MNKNIVRTLSVFVIAFTSLFLINIGDVMAVGNGDGKGYAKCYYTWQESQQESDTGTCDYSAEMCVLGTNYKAFKLGIAAYGADDGNSYSWATVGCGQSTTAESAKTSSKTCGINNYSSTFGYLVKNKDYFYSNRKWVCPDTVYINKTNFSDDMGVFFDKTSCGSGCKSVSLSGSDVKQTSKKNEPTDLVVDDYSGNSSTPSESVTDQAEAEKWKDASNIDYDKIKGAVKDPKEATEGKTGTCDLIPDSIREFLGHLFFIIQIIGIILMLILTFVEFVKVITASEDGGIKTAFKNSIKRIVAVVVLLLLPTLILWIIDMVNDSYGNSHTVIGANGDPICIKDKIKGN